MQDKVEALLQAIEEATENEDFQTLIENLMDLRDLYFDIGLEYIQVMEFKTAHDFFSNSTMVCEQLTDYFLSGINSLEESDSGEMDDTDSVKEEIESLMEENEFCMVGSDAYAEFSQGQLHKLNRNPGGAIENFDRSIDSFEILYEKTGDANFKFLFDFIGANKTIAKGLEDLIKGNNNNAKVEFQRGRIALQLIIEELSENEDQEEIDSLTLKPIVEMVLGECEGLYYLADAKNLFTNRNFSGAFEQYTKLCDTLLNTLENMPEDIPKEGRDLQFGEYHMFCVQKYLAQGEMFRNNEDWDEALEAYKKAQMECEKSSLSYIKSGIPQALTAQEIVINYSSTINISINECKKEEKLKKKLKALENELSEIRKSLAESLKSSGVTVNTTQEVVSTVEQNVQFVQSIENKVRANLEDLISKLKETQIEPAQKDKIEEKAKNLVNSDEHGQSFFERAKKFTADVKDIIGNIGEAAKPIQPVIKLLTGFLL